jgi:Holliday junction DNA helicase RuvA
MIATLNGPIAEKLSDVVVLNVGGIGYGLLVTPEDFGRLEVGVNAKLYVYEHIREQAYDLYGFVKYETKQLFELLLGVNGVGPKMALSILSIGNADEVRLAIAGGDVKLICRANGVGKRVAERVVIELKDKVGLIGADLDSLGLLRGDAQLLQDEAIEALVALGYSTQDAAISLEKIDRTLTVEERIRLALKEKR